MKIDPSLDEYDILITIVPMASLLLLDNLISNDHPCLLAHLAYTLGETYHRTSIPYSGELMVWKDTNS